MRRVAQSPFDFDPAHFVKSYGADGGTRTRTRIPSQDFKSRASTIPPHPLGHTGMVRAKGLEPPRY